MMLSVPVRMTGQGWERERDTVADRSAIEWTTATWNPTTGCDRISVGCDHCYALALAGRLKAIGQPKYQSDGDPRTSGPGFAVTVHPGVLRRLLQPQAALPALSDIPPAELEATRSGHASGLAES
jgi:Protein of unknown function (DUF5131)